MGYIIVLIRRFLMGMLLFVVAQFSLHYLSFISPGLHAYVSCVSIFAVDTPQFSSPFISVDEATKFVVKEFEVLYEFSHAQTKKIGDLEEISKYLSHSLDNCSEQMNMQNQIIGILRKSIIDHSSRIKRLETSVSKKKHY